ncbi:MAG: hypothetical protein LBB94_05610 [Clostridiales bacterium]|jgi:predicted AAA+ superfamily ATPase|nr:hypothetical protein [Clostridiales bacterium]
MNYLRALFSEVHIKDIVERKKIEREDVLDILASSVGSLTNPTKLTNTLKLRQRISVSPNTIKCTSGI